MIRVLIVDDETLVRVTLRRLLRWEDYGCEIVGDCVNGQQALEFMEKHPVDLLITDMKMPVLDGLGLLRRLGEGTVMPVTVVLSGYDEFELVREAFRLGVYDYLLKANLTTATLEQLLRNLRQKVFHDGGANYQAQSPEQAQPLAPGDYGVVVLSLDDFAKEAARFGGDLREKLQKPLVELVRQLPLVAGRGTITAADPGQYELCWAVRDKSRYHGAIGSVTRQILSVWRDYMNISASAAVSEMTAAQGVPEKLQLCRSMVKLAPLQGRGSICTEKRWADFARCYHREAQNYDDLIQSLTGGGQRDFEAACTHFLNGLTAHEEDAHIRTIALLLTRMNEKWRSCGEDFYSHFPEHPSLWETLDTLPTAGERVLWLRNTLRRLRSELAGKEDANPMQRARHYLQDNFANPELTLKMVADQVGFNEKYFSTRFTKEFDCTVMVYLNRLRLERAKELLQHTDWRIYEVAAAVGYNSVEHFNHTFKKILGISPKEYRQRAQNS